jgi:uncharacterized membrane protein YesL
VRAFLVVWKSMVSFYNEMFLFVGLSLLWWVTGGIFAVVVALAVYAALIGGGLFALCLAPLAGILMGPAQAGMATVARRAARELHVDRSFFWEGFRTHWKQALAVNAVSMVILSLLLLNLIFYAYQRNLIQMLAIVFTYLSLFWLSVQLYIFPVLIGLKTPTVWGTLRTATILAFGNPLFSILLLILAGALTALSIVIPLLLLMAWPAVILLLGDHSLTIFMERFGIGEKKYEKE